MAGLDNTAILLADLQDTIVPHSGTNEEAALRRSAKALAGFARDLGIPSVVSVVPFGTDSPQRIAELREALPDAPIIVRHGPRIFAHPPSVDAIRKRGPSSSGTETPIRNGQLGARSAVVVSSSTSLISFMSVRRRRRETAQPCLICCASFSAPRAR